jgi:carboxypeptidase Taq
METLMEAKLARLKEIIHEIYDLQAASALLDWDEQTYMPPAGALERGEQGGTLARLGHERQISDEFGRLLEDLKPYASQLDPDSDDACLIRYESKEFDKQKRVPSSYVDEFAQISTLSHAAWVKARAENKFKDFEPHLAKVVEMRRQYASFFAPYSHVYDPLLDDFEPGMKTEEVKAIFNILRPHQVALIQAIAQKPSVDDSFLTTSFSEQAQWDFGVEVITRFGYDWKRGRQDKAAHPFTTEFGLDDVRITTRFDSTRGMSALFSTMHECGHAFYGMGAERSLRRTPLSGGTSSALHESQSRLWENLVGRSRAFWSFFYPRAQAYFPTQLGNIALDQFYRAVNKVEPSLIRVEADEATYNLHIMLRLELEIALMEGSLDVRHLPDAWNTRMQEYLGITPPTDALGVMQDVHWSEGLIGYFPTYALGNLVSAQLWERMLADIPDLEDQIGRGQFDHLLNWLIEHIHRVGAKFEPQDLVTRVTGSKINPDAYIRYLGRKFGQIYDL